MPGMPIDPNRLPYTQEGVLAEGGFVETDYTSDCWACGEPTRRYKPGVQRDIWRCDCGTEWSTATYLRYHWVRNQTT